MKLIAPTVCGLALLMSATVACSGASGGSGPSFQMAGDYESSDGVTADVTFADATHFLMVSTAEDGSDVVIEGTYEVDPSGTSITFTCATTGATQTLPFDAELPSSTDAGADAGGSASVLADTVKPLGVSLTSGTPQTLVPQTGVQLVAESNVQLEGFAMEGHHFKQKTHQLITCGQTNCAMSRWQDRTPQELAPNSHYYDELGHELGVMTPRPLVNVGMRHTIDIPGTGKITMVYAFAGGVAGWVPEALFNHGHGVNMPTYEDPSKKTIGSYRFQVPADKAEYAHECINPSGCNGRGDNTLEDYLPGTMINLPEGVPTPTNAADPSSHGSVVSATSVLISDPNAIFHASSVTLEGVLWDYNNGHPKLSSKKVEWVYGEINGRWCWTPRMALVRE